MRPIFQNESDTHTHTHTHAREAQPDQWHFDATDRLMEVLRTRGLMPPKKVSRTKWATNLMKLDKHYTREDINETLENLIKMLTWDYAPVVRSTGAFTDKYVQIKDAFVRYTEQSTKDLSQVKVSDRLKKTLSYFDHWGWPAGSFDQASKIMQKSLDNYQAFVCRVEEAAKTDKLFARQIRYVLHDCMNQLDYSGFSFQCWLELLLRVAQLEKYGSMTFMIWTPQHDSATHPLQSWMHSLTNPNELWNLMKQKTGEK